MKPAVGMFFYQEVLFILIDVSSAVSSQGEKDGNGYFASKRTQIYVLSHNVF